MDQPRVDVSSSEALESWEHTRLERAMTEAAIAAEPPSASSSASVRVLASTPAAELPDPDARGPGDDRPTLGRFQLLRRLGSGAMGVVFEGYDPELDRRVALKVLRPEIEARQSLQARSRMLREAQALARLRHPNVTMVYEVGTSDRGALFIAMELVEGLTLTRWLRARRRGWREIVEVFLQAGRGLAAAHRAGLVHRDFKPDNVIVDDGGMAHVVDFGLARSAGLAELLPTLDDAESGAIALHLTSTGAVLGTPAYMAPEQFQGGPPRAASDQFSFCVAMFEALYGRRPFAGHDLPSLQRSLVRGQVVGPRRGVPRSLYRVLRRGLSVDATRRFGTMEALLEALAGCRQRKATPRSLALVAGLAVAALAGSILSPRGADGAPPSGPAPASISGAAEIDGDAYAGSTRSSTSPSSTSASSAGPTSSTLARAGNPSPP